MDIREELSRQASHRKALGPISEKQDGAPWLELGGRGGKKKK